MYNVITYIKANRVSCLLAVIIMCGNAIWPIWFYDNYIAWLCIFILSAKYFNLNNVPSKAKVATLYGCFFFLLLPIFRGLHISYFIYIVAYLMAFSINDRIKYVTVEIVAKTVAIIVLISLPCWLLYVAGFSFPLLSVIDIGSFKGGGAGQECLMYNYGMFVVSLGLENMEIFRFYSMFDEPGVLGTLSAFLLYGLKYDFKKWYCLTIFVGALFTFSLAFYILTLFGYVWSKSSNLKSIIKYGIGLVLVAFIIVYFFQDNETFQKAIMYRMDNIFNGDGSVAERGDDYGAKYYSDLITSMDAFLGIGFRNYSSLPFSGASYKLFIIENGILGTMSLFFLFWAMLRFRNKKTLGLLLIFVISFIQRPYAMTGWQIILFSCLVGYSSYNDNKEYHHNKIKLKV